MVKYAKQKRYKNSRHQNDNMLGLYYGSYNSLFLHKNGFAYFLLLHGSPMGRMNLESLERLDC